MTVVIVAILTQGGQQSPCDAPGTDFAPIVGGGPVPQGDGCAAGETQEGQAAAVGEPQRNQVDGIDGDPQPQRGERTGGTSSDPG
jgi:hypothetical protein